MEKPVIISIRGVQTTAPGEEDVMELVTQGVLGGDERELTLRFHVGNGPWTDDAQG